MPLAARPQNPSCPATTGVLDYRLALRLLHLLHRRCASLHAYDASTATTRVLRPCRYGLDPSTSTSMELATSSGATPRTAADAAPASACRPRHLSKRERVAAKRGLSPNSLDQQRAAAAGATAAAQPTASTPKPAPPPAAKRGHGGKLKKAAAKYRDQDEEDAALLADFNAATGAARSRKEKRKERAAKMAAKRVAGLEVRRK
jgi:hypothetical protein